ncbi:glycosyl transferase family 1 [Capnocytophaga sp. H4358]|uniref:glycosyltransferase family 4 protein n=1 Tax=Capnocytophaga sp. H4358 TaxID=1945658 RepID=UPI000BB1D6A7|nr:glycosyltransferase family 1 protein [Capnocytophaga sp. H4358]ATA73623.1 glycosyl transferase family 1 [Capnocytophaga sp. H4358]
MKKILIDLERLRYPNTGLANVFSNIAQGIENQSCLFSVSYFGPEKELIKIVPNSKIVSYRKWHKYYENFSQQFDLIHISNQGSPYFRKKYKNTPKLLTLHDLNFLHEPLSPRKKVKIHNRVNKTLENVDYLVCISDFVKQDVLKHQNILNLNHLKDIFVIHNGIELPEQRSYSLGKYDFLKDRKYLLNIGVLFAKKNQKTLIEMLPYLSEDLVLVASGSKKEYESEIKNTIQQLNLQDRVHILNNISQEEKYAIIQHCQAMCHPSLAEGFGIPPIEAMAFGKPVFLSTSTSLPEIGGEIAFYFENFDPKTMANTLQKGLKTYYENIDEFLQKTKKWVAQFDYQVMASNYLEIYKKILG